jgi:hypothetical protein
LRDRIVNLRVAEEIAAGDDAPRVYGKSALVLNLNPNHGGSHARETESRTSGLGLVATAFKLNNAPLAGENRSGLLGND